MAIKKCSCTNPIAVRGSRAKFCHERIKDLKKFDPKSFRTKVYRAHRITFGCPKGQYSHGKCRVPVQIQAILHPVGEAKCPTPGVTINKNPFLETSLAIATGITAGEIGKHMIRRSGIMKNPFSDLDKRLAEKYKNKIKYTIGDTVIVDVRNDAKLRNLLPEGKTENYKYKLRKMDHIRNLYITKKKKSDILKNPGANWHKQEMDAARLEMKSAVGKEFKAYQKGKYDAHHRSREVSEDLGINPLYHGRTAIEKVALELYEKGWGIESIIMELKKRFTIAPSTAEYIAKRAARISHREVKYMNPKRTRLARASSKKAYFPEESIQYVQDMITKGMDENEIIEHLMKTGVSRRSTAYELYRQAFISKKKNPKQIKYAARISHETLISYIQELIKKGTSRADIIGRLIIDEGFTRTAASLLHTQALKAMLKEKKNLQQNPLRGAVKIYDDVLAIEAKKGKDSLWPGENFRHDFKKSKGKASVYGLPDGSVLIKGNKKLWKTFDYSKK